MSPNMKWQTLLTALLCVTSAVVKAQEFYPASFQVEGEEVQQPYIGGMNCPQLSTADFNADGREDLYIFDRVGDIHLPFINKGTSTQPDYQYAPAYAKPFPEIVNWVLLRDYDDDGIPDMFTYSDVIGIDGIAVFKGFYQNDSLRFERLDLNSRFNLLSFTGNNNRELEIFVSSIDYPAIDDVDCDGDLDILTFNVSGGFVELYSNQSVELGYGRDSLLFERSDDCWGGFFESGISVEVDLAQEPGECVNGGQNGLYVSPRHAGSTLLTYDADSDGVRELVLGDLSFNELNVLHNAGSCEAAFIDRQSAAFPDPDRPVVLPTFPAAFHLDINGDGLEDMLAAPNSEQNSEDKDVLWLYERSSAADSASYQFQRRDFLVDQTIDLGTGAHPAYVDYNSDGLLDLVIGNEGFFQQGGGYDARLFLFENVGSPKQPAFSLVDDDYLELSRFSESSRGFTPSFGDLDGDGDLDFIAGETFGMLIYGENTAGPQNPLQIDNLSFGFLGIDVGQSSVPAIGDINGDGLQDIIVGERSGNVNYFQNTGTVGNPQFTADPRTAPNLEVLGNINTRAAGRITGFSAPVIVENEEGQPLIVTGADQGEVLIYEIAPENLSRDFPLLDPSLLGIDVGSRSNVDLADLDGDGTFELAIGNQRGGIALYRTALSGKSDVTPVRNLLRADALRIQPNPSRGAVQIRLQDDILLPVQMQLYDARGRLLQATELQEQQREIDLSTLQPGMYILRIENREGALSRRLIRH